MPARIVLIHDDTGFLGAVAGMLRARGHDVAAFANSMVAYDALKHPQRAEVVVTSIRFPANQPHGLGVFRAARLSRPSLKVIFIGSPEDAEYVEDEGTVFTIPVRPDQIVQAVEEILTPPPL
jgi:DNA-binding NtrC family response regulator